MSKKTKYSFRLIDGVTDERIKYVHPLQQKNMSTIVKIADKYDIGLIVFGSSITLKCNSFSDIDLAIITKENGEKDFLSFVSEVKDNVLFDIDFIYYNELKKTELIKQEIDETGIFLKRRN